MIPHVYAGFPGGAVVENLLAKAGDSGDADSIPESGRSPGGGNGNPLQYSCLENSWTERSVGSQRITDDSAAEHACLKHTSLQHLPRVPLVCLKAPPDAGVYK